MGRWYVWHPVLRRFGLVCQIPRDKRGHLTIKLSDGLLAFWRMREVC